MTKIFHPLFHAFPDTITRATKWSRLYGDFEDVYKNRSEPEKYREDFLILQESIEWFQEQYEANQIEFLPMIQEVGSGIQMAWEMGYDSERDHQLFLGFIFMFRGGKEFLKNNYHQK